MPCNKMQVGYLRWKRSTNSTIKRLQYRHIHVDIHVCLPHHRRASEQLPAIYLLDFKHLEIKDELRVGRNIRRRSLFAVAQVSWDGDTTLATDCHAGYAYVPAFDDGAVADGEGEGFAFFVG